MMPLISQTDDFLMPKHMALPAIGRSKPLLALQSSLITSAEQILQATEGAMSEYGALFAQFDLDIANRVAGEQKLQKLSSAPSAEQLQLHAQIQSAVEYRDQEQLQIEEEYQALVQEVTEHFQSELSNLRKSHESVVGSVRAEADTQIEQLIRQRENSEWVVTSVLDDTAEDSPLRELEKYQAAIEKTQADQEGLLEALNESANQSVAKFHWTLSTPAAKENVAAKNKKAANELFQSAFEESERVLSQIRSTKLPKLFLGFRGIFVFVILFIAITIPVYLFVEPSLAGVSGPRLQGAWIGLSAAAGGIAALLLTIILYSLGAMRLSDLFRQFEQSRADTLWLHQRWTKIAQQDLQKRVKSTAAKQKKIEKERSQALERYEATLETKRAEIVGERDSRLKLEIERYEMDRNQSILQRESQLQRLKSEHERRIGEWRTRWSNELERLEGELKGLQALQSRGFSESWMQTKSNWEEASQAFFETVSTIHSLDKKNNPTWSVVVENWEPAQTMPCGIRHGHLSVNLQHWENAISNDVRLEPRTTTFEIPGEVAFPGMSSTLFKSPDHSSRKQAIDALQTMMLRLLLQVPPGKIRFTIIDPISLGESFGGFMHLADYDELMVTNRIWTESGQIEARLADLTEHMENVFQTYLRNEFQTIEEYNQSAGEVAEPYHFLVISDFPAKFSEIAARRLTSIINSGPRCGVYTLMNMDPAKPLPNNFELNDIVPHMTAYSWLSGNFHAEEEILSPWPVTIETPPDPQTFTSIVKMIGEASKDARKVEVSFDRIAPVKNDIWTRDSRHELEIPLGRAGATKLQTMRLGKGTSQHMLVAGKTGSGKSTFLHILVTNLALHYGPDEVNFFLIDFKKGVEFKEYATSQLPHAQVIAIESDREFGVSALQRLDEVLQERGELFRKHGVQDIAGYRNANPDQALPRILLIVDEFQEFFIEDDKLSQSAAQLLDRLVRQGRAFGVHVILGSQTLGGAYSLARTTLGQVAVRVALQCSDADAHLILSEENTAARLLTRPGEAIYNDANGMVEGNHPFQIGWLSDQERRSYLDQLNEKAKRDGIPTKSPIVFEGNIPSDIGANSELKALAEEFSKRQKEISTPEIWLGDAVEIQPATSLKFHQQSGSHLLIVGQDAEAATGMMTSAAIMLAAAQTPQQRTSLCLFDGNPPDTQEANDWKNLCETLPVSIKRVTPRQTAEAVTELSEELARRSATSDEQFSPQFVLVHNIAKFRELRKAEDDYGMGSFGSSAAEKPIDPGKQFSTLLKDGPLYGIHFIIWCDSYNNVERSFSRQTMKELELRVALQMNPADSSNLIDTPAASRLGTHRALLYREETGLTEKFRPYGCASKEWIQNFAEILKHAKPTEFATDLGEFSIL